MSGPPPEAHAAALAGFSHMTVHRLLALLRRHHPIEAYAVAVGDVRPAPGSLIEKVLANPDVRDAWAASARRVSPAEVWDRCRALDIEVSVVGTAAHPALLADDPLPPPVLFSRGDRVLLDGRRVAVVGTRNATMVGRHLARRFGDELAYAGVHIVSGLARGIDGEAHRGVLARRQPGSGRPIGVVASGLDVVYPREHRTLWDEVASYGLLVSEWPPGAEPAAHRFPLRNRIIAGLSEIVVVVESRERGGSLVTADLAAERGVPVMAVPGSAANRAAMGVNALLRDGSAPVLDAGDVLTALQLDHTLQLPFATERRITPRRDDVASYRACQQRASTVDGVATTLGRSPIEVAMSLARLEQGGWLAQSDGWFEVVGSPLP